MSVSSPKIAKAARTTIAVQGARVHNLKNISVEIPRDKLIVITGLSGSGKSTIANVLLTKFLEVGGRPVTILAWDVDGFKSINDAYGHKAGDKVLRVIGQHLARHVRDTDFVGRYGGEEFVMLLVGTDTAEARTVAEKIRLEISQLGFHFHDRPVSITACCGITGFAGDDTPDAAFDRADKALYQAKDAGRNCCIIA